MNDIIIATVILFMCMYPITMESKDFIQDARVLAIANDTQYNMSATIPLIISTLDPSSSYALCHSSSQVQELVPFFLVMCKHLGFTSLQRIYSVNISDLNSNLQVGVVLDIMCAGYELQLSQCHLKSQLKQKCQQFLGIHCAGCNYSIEMEAGGKYSIEFPRYMPCAPNTFCEWSVFTKKRQRNKNIILEFKNHDVDPVLQNFTKENAFKGRRLEIQWFDSQIEKWIIHKESENNLENIGTIKVPSDKLIIRYFVVDCCFTSIRKTLIAIMYNEPLNTEVPFDNPRENIFFMILPCSVLFVGAIIVISCLCCDIKRKKIQKFNINSYTSREMESAESQNEIDEDNCLMVAFRGFLHSSRNATLNNFEDDFHKERLHLNLDAVDPYKSDGSSAMALLHDDSEGCRPNFDRMTSFEVGSKHLFSQSPNVLDNTYEVSSAIETVATTLPIIYIKEENVNINHRGFLSSLRRLLSCLVMRSENNCSNGQDTLRPIKDGCKELDESSLENLLEKFNSLVLSFHWSDTTNSCSIRSDADFSIQADADQPTTIIELVNKSSGKSSDFCPGQPSLPAEAALLTQNSCSSTDVWESPCLEEEEDVNFSCKSTDSEISYFSVWQNSHPPTTCSEADTFTSFSFECPSPAIDKFLDVTGPKLNISTLL